MIAECNIIYCILFFTAENMRSRAIAGALCGCSASHVLCGKKTNTYTDSDTVHLEEHKILKKKPCSDAGL
jgi:hypothetical protein